MSARNERIAADVLGYLKAHEEKSLLRFITCGSVDDGKSTLIGRLLYDSKLLFEDQLAALEADSRIAGTQGGNIDFALLVDGLAAEREQGITIDVAYRFFSTEKRKFIVADTPGHEQYTRNMATGASTADLAILLIDARKGLLAQTRRHSFIASLLGIRDIVLAVNKMDLVDYSRTVFEEITAEYAAFAATLGLERIVSIPLSALNGVNMLSRSEKTPWYEGPSLLEHLETVEIADEISAQPFRLPVQWVNRPDQDFRGFSGTIAGGSVRPGDRVRVLPSGQETTVSRIVTAGGDRPLAGTGDAVTLTLTDEIDVSRGDFLAAASDPAAVSDQFEVNILWMSDTPLYPGRPYLFKFANRTVPGTVMALKYKINVNTLEHVAAKTLALNEVAVATLSLDARVAFDAYAENRTTGSFIVIDRIANQTAGLGVIGFALRRATNVHWQALDVNKAARAAQKGQKPVVLWFTGLSGSGKSTVANLVEKRLHARGHHTALLDGDNVRHGLNKDLGFTPEDRIENIRRVGEVAKLMTDAGLITLVSFISPFRAERRMVREMVEDGEFIEIFVDTPLAVCEARDVKGLYAKAREGRLKNFTGIDSPYERPESAEICLEGANALPEEFAGLILDYLDKNGYLSA